MRKFNVTVQTSKTSSKLYSTKEEAILIADRLSSIANENQKKYDGVQVVDYISIDEVEVEEDGSLSPIDYFYYLDGSTLV